MVFLAPVLPARRHGPEPVQSAVTNRSKSGKHRDGQDFLNFSDSLRFVSEACFTMLSEPLGQALEISEMKMSIRQKS